MSDPHHDRVMGLAEQWIGQPVEPYWYADSVPVDEPFRALRMCIDDANKAYMMAAANKRAGNPDALIRFDLMHLEEAAQNLERQCNIEMAAMYDPEDGGF